MALQFELAGSQYEGARDYQEDAFLITHMTDADGNPSALVIVADGMGGHAAGNVASNMAVQAFSKHVSSSYPSESPGEVLHQAVIKANNSIKETVKETPALAGMGCTMVAAILEGNKLWWASVGDSHLYLLRNKELTKKNADHSYGGFLERMAAAGTPVEPEPGLARNMLMSAITGDEINEIDVPVTPFELQAGDRLLICSDGMDTLSTGKIIQFSEWSESPKECAEALLQAVKDADMPKQDNTTAVVINIREKAVAPAAPVPPTPAAVSLEQAHDEKVTPLPVAPPTPEPVEEETKKSKAGLIIGIAAVIVVAIGAGIFFVQSGKKEAADAVTADASMGQSETGIDETADAETGVDEPEETADEETEAAATESPPPAAATTASVTQAPAAAPAFAEGSEFSDPLKNGSPGPAMIVIPAGTFEMGSPGSSRHGEERPRHSVKVDRFAISKYEITFEQYDVFATATGRKLPDNLYMDRKTHPVIFVTWDDAYYYAEWLSEQTRAAYRLPSEAEWEYAASAGKRSPHWWGFNMEPNMAHCQIGCSTPYDPKKPTAVGSFKPNPFGVYDTAGNVAEWVEDCWHDDYNGAPATAKVWVGGDCVYRAVRGGSYFSPEDSIRHSKRDKFKSDQTYDHIGIRVVRELP
jgi:formylglycine-generating enzyme required for sulfatase activity/serine/threonine protein phosphatase PrpC